MRELRQEAITKCEHIAEQAVTVRRMLDDIEAKAKRCQVMLSEGCHAGELPLPGSSDLDAMVGRLLRQSARLDVLVMLCFEAENETA